MNRYNLKHYQEDEDFSEEMEESEDGYWVKFKDAELISKIGFGRVNCGVCGADLSKGNHAAHCSVGYPVECNCLERLSLGHKVWICPAHGYKRL